MSTTLSAPRRLRRRTAGTRGVMLVEILLALAISGLIAAGVASLLFATASGTKDRQELRQRNVRVEVLTSRVDAAIRSSSVLLARDSKCLVLWVADVKKNAQPNLSELRRIEWDATTKQLICYRAPATLADASDTAYDLAATDFLTTTAALRGSASFPGTVWANNVSGWNSSPAAPTSATRVIGYDVTLTLSTGEAYTTRSSTALRGTASTGGNG
jgi:type II secretory pathway pseudopilin PulG